MSIILEEYLKKLSNNLDEFLDGVLSAYKVIIYDKMKDIQIGLLRFNQPPKGKAFLFILPKEEMQYFHTDGMKFSIKHILFFNSKKELVASYDNVKPGLKNISSKIPAKYVVEIP